MEMFSSAEEKEKLDDIDWIDDLKFHIDNNDHLLTNYIFPSVFRHKDHVDRSDAYKIYMRPLKHCLEDYCKKYKIDDIEKKFTEEKLVSLAKQIAEEQKKHIENHDYD
jgi:ATP-dependent protease Clp ATPase subunit